MADEKKMAALQKHLEELESEPTEVLAERYGLTPSDLGAFGRVMQKVYNKMAPELVDRPILDEYPDPVRFDDTGPEQTGRRRSMNLSVMYEKLPRNSLVGRVR